MIHSLRAFSRAVVVFAGLLPGLLWAADPFIPRTQTKPPGPPLSPQEALERMVVPEGFSVELVASEPDLQNPVAMAFDERGRIWVTESFEYPRREPGPGRDRVKILEDTDQDGAVDKVAVFAEGLNIPSGIAIGGGGVWVANSPDILLYKDTDGDDVADSCEVVVTGFGRDDTHELPNSLTWGPDGWLYGLNGVFNGSRVEQNGKAFEFTCALFRIHPRTHEFQLFAQGTSNPWGIAWDGEGSAFVSACVIDHLWHLAERGYYHSQSGYYPPFTWKIDSIVEHKHQLAAYCGITWFDSAAYPEQYREKLYMGNIHGGCINSDRLSRRGATYLGEEEPDFLTANDVWFMPVVQKTGPDGCLYVLDWYDRYHCYQDANADPAGIDRGHGRLYRVRYGRTPRAPAFNLATESDQQLITRLGSDNVFFREVAQRLLAERNDADTRRTLQTLVLDEQSPRKQRLHALWSLIGGGPLEQEFHLALLGHGDSVFRSWAVRAAGNMADLAEPVRKAVFALAADPAPDVQLQVAITAGKFGRAECVPILLAILANPGDDVLIPHVVWQILEPLLEAETSAFLEGVDRALSTWSGNELQIVPRSLERLTAREQFDPRVLAELMRIASAHAEHAGLSADCARVLAEHVQSGEIAGDRAAALSASLREYFQTVEVAGSEQPAYVPAMLLAASLGDSAGLAAVRELLTSTAVDDDVREQALEALVAANDEGLLSHVVEILRDATPDLQRRTLTALARLDSPEVATAVLSAYSSLPSEVQPQVIELLTGRAAWARALLAAMADKTVPAEAMNLNQARKLLAFGDAELAELVRTAWGTIREERSPAREQVIADMRALLRATPGDAVRGEAVYRKVCGQCHKIYGQGQDVGPEITSNGRSSFEQLLSNVFDPSLTIGAAYQARTVVTTDGRVVTGLLVEDSPQRVVLRIQGGKEEIIARNDVDEMEVSRLSLMPEDLQKQITPPEMADLFAYLTLDRPPSDPAARQLPGLADVPPQETLDPLLFNMLVCETAPAFRCAASGEAGVALLEEYRGRTRVLRTHPLDRETPAVLLRSLTVPEGASRLVLDVAHDERGDWLLIVRANGETLLERPVSEETTDEGWAEVRVDLSRFASQSIELELLNAPSGWSWEYGYWANVRIETASDR